MQNVTPAKIESLIRNDMPNQWRNPPRGQILRVSDNYRNDSHSTMPLAIYVEKNFIPEHVARKTRSGRTHYKSILKHVLNPELVARIFADDDRCMKSRLKPVPDWPYLDNVKLCDLNSDHVRRLTMSADVHGYSPQTIKHIRAVVGAVISHARKGGLFSGESPIAEVQLPTMVRRTARNLTIIQAKEILRLMKYPEREIALITITMGLSISEICALQWKHVNLTHAPFVGDGEVVPPRCILVKRRWNPKGLIEPTRSSARTVEIPEPLFRRLLSLKRQGSHPDLDCFLLTSRSGLPLCPSDTRMGRLKPIGRTLGIPWLSWQVIRRAHQALLSELRVQLNEDLVSSAR